MASSSSTIKTLGFSLFFMPSNSSKGVPWRLSSSRPRALGLRPQQKQPAVFPEARGPRPEASVHARSESTAVILAVGRRAVVELFRPCGGGKGGGDRVDDHLDVERL